MGWSQSRVDEVLLPVLKRMHSREVLEGDGAAVRWGCHGAGLPWGCRGVGLLRVGLQ